MSKTETQAQRYTRRLKAGVAGRKKTVAAIRAARQAPVDMNATVNFRGINKDRTQ